MTGRDLARRQQSAPVRRTRVDGELTASRDELVVRLRPTPVSGGAAAGRERLTVTTRVIHPLEVAQPVVYQPSPGWVFDREAITAWIMFGLVVALVIAVWLVLP